MDLWAIAGITVGMGWCCLHWVHLKTSWALRMTMVGILIRECSDGVEMLQMGQLVMEGMYFPC